MAFLTDTMAGRPAEGGGRAIDDWYRTLYEDTPSMYFTVDPEGTVLSVNQFGAAQLGYSPEELLGKSVLKVFLEADRPEAAAHVAECVAHPGRVFRWELRKIRKDLSLLWVKETARAVRGRDGRLVVLVVCEDITERRRAEEAEAELRSALEKAACEWHATFDAMEPPILVLDAEGRVARLNRAAIDAIGVEFRDILGRSMDSLGSAQPWLEAARLVAALRAGGQPTSGQAHDQRSDRTWDITVRPVSTAGAESRLIVVAREITAVVKLQESVRQSETMSAMGSLVAGVAHEVRNPLFAIAATLDAFEARFATLEEHRPYIRLLRVELGRLSDLMGELLAYGRPQTLDLAPMPVAGVIAQAVHSCGPLAKQSQVKLVNTVQYGLPPLLMDRNRLLQVFRNLLENAIQHTPAGESVVVSALERKPEDGGHWVDCRVEDSGPGFREEDLPRIFEPFFTRRRGGTGLGLSIVQRIVDAHGGRVLVANRPTGGGSVTVRLPLTTPS